MDYCVFPVLIGHGLLCVHQSTSPTGVLVSGRTDKDGVRPRSPLLLQVEEAQHTPTI